MDVSVPVSDPRDLRGEGQDVRVPGRLRSWLIRTGLLLVVFLGVFSVAEMGLRLLGHRPWRVTDLKIRVDPGGKLFQTHPTLGYNHLPEQYQITLSKGYSFTVTHGADTLRITHRQHDEADNKDCRPIWIFGCSITHGWSVNDHETYPWVLQEKLLDREVINFGVSGYGTIHSLIQLRKALTERKPPEVAVIAYGALHDERNVFLRQRRKVVFSWNKLGPLEQPYGKLDDTGQLRTSMSEVVYAEFPLMRLSATIHFLEQGYNKFEALYAQSHQVSAAIIREFDELCRANNIPLVIAGITTEKLTGEMLDWCRQQGMTAMDLSVDVKQERYNNKPHDAHPSALAHKEYASKLHAYLSGAGLVD